MKTNFFPVFLAISILAFSCKKEEPVPSDEDEQLVVISPFINKVYEYKPAPGQFTNEGVADLEKVKVLIGATGKGMVSLGGFGGYIIFGFDHSVSNQNGVDIGIYGNPLISSGNELSEPGIVCVMQDSNKNGLPDDTWYELAGSDYAAPTTIKNYVITYFKPANAADDVYWSDNQGNDGFVLKNQFHNQAYYPNWATNNQISLNGTLVGNTLKAGNIIRNMPLDVGYADNGSSEYINLQEQLGRGYNTFDIDWAVDASGLKVALNAIDFVKVYTAQNCNGNPDNPNLTNPMSRFMGEISTEISGAIDIKLYRQK